jgi:riboflavin kinase/FMN adenylyltransferase
VGFGRGHDLDFPTANISVPEKLLPKDGVYAAVARHDGRDRAALVSIGTNPQFDGKRRTIEAWLRDFNETIYGHGLTLRDLRYLREQRLFASVDELVAQMRTDLEAVAYPSYG